MAPLTAVVLLLGLFLAGCQIGEQGTSPRPKPEAGRDVSAVPYALRVAPEQLTRVTLQGPRNPQPITLELEGESWRVTAPIAYAANPSAVEYLIAVLAEIEIAGSAPDDPDARRRHGVDRERGIEVRAYAGKALKSHLFVGRSRGERTAVRQAGGARILFVRGRCRSYFDQPLDALRDPVITDVEALEIEKVTYEGPIGTLVLVPVAGSLGKFAPKRTTIRNFDLGRSSKNVAVLAHLRAKGFVDDPVKRDTGLFEPDTPKATLHLREGSEPRTVTIWVGERSEQGFVHVRTSRTDQIFLVSSHLESSLVPRRSHFERSDDLMRQLDAHGKHRHEHGTPPATQIPPEMLRGLRELARKQRVK